MFNDQSYPDRKIRMKKLFILPAVILLFFGLTAAVQYLWNAVLPGAVHASVISYWEAAGLLVLSRILFGRFHFGGVRRGRPDFRGFQRPSHDEWKNMTNEDREKLKEEFRERCRTWKRGE